MIIAGLKNRATLAKTGPLYHILLMRRDEMIAR
jgi:hypothetical protein